MRTRSKRWRSSAGVRRKIVRRRGGSVKRPCRSVGHMEPRHPSNVTHILVTNSCIVDSIRLVGGVSGLWIRERARQQHPRTRPQSKRISSSSSTLTSSSSSSRGSDAQSVVPKRFSCNMPSHNQLVCCMLMFLFFCFLAPQASPGEVVL